MPIIHNISTVGSQDVTAPNIKNTIVLNSQDMAGLNF